MLSDLFKRKIDYLRLSVTERCNLRCEYCMPFDSSSLRSSSLRASPSLHLLTFEEIERLVRILVSLGIRRVRLTGGEPFVRKNLPDLVRKLCQIPQLEEVLMTTNGILLKRYAQDLRGAGLKKINIHLDSLDAKKFRQVTRWGDLSGVLKGIEVARKVGFFPIKINTVLQKGFNDDEVENLLLFCVNRGFILRLIELMPIGPARERTQAFISCGEIRERLAEKYTLLPILLRRGSGPAVYYRVVELETEIGFISPVSQPFCERCNRIRISADGRFQDCLAYDGRFSLRDLLRDPDCSDEAIARQIADLMQGKRESHFNFAQWEEERTPCMYGIGG
ncbi:MAG: GTP 3',8-cyclase MoaA [Deltaproteobacteria bacterium]|nr:GTP 3',8-cyclase MoaA [Deltaproteobacteria bacterium]